MISDSQPMTGQDYPEATYPIKTSQVFHFKLVHKVVESNHRMSFIHAGRL